MLIKRPIITEKTLRLAETQNKYTFEVDLNADKVAAASEVARTFGVKVLVTKTHTRLGQRVTYGRKRIAGRKADRKFMIFKLKDGDKIDLFASK